jgi:hypothetical protein
MRVFFQIKTLLSGGLTQAEWLACSFLQQLFHYNYFSKSAPTLHLYIE